jgi:hypothetical protein
MAEAQKRIIPMNTSASYLKARKLTKDKGGLPSNALHDDCLVMTYTWERLKGLYDAWAREVLVYPQSGGKFKKGKDVVDSHEDEKGRRWILPASYVPKEAIGKKRVGLFIDPEDVREENDNVIVHPKKIEILYPFLQGTADYGKVDENTRIPLTIKRKVLESLSRDKYRCLLRNKGAGVRPLRRSNTDWTDRLWIVANKEPTYVAGVSYVGPEEAMPKEQEASELLLRVRGITPDELNKLLRAADTSTAELSEVVQPAKLEAIQRLVQVLEIKK